MRLALLSDIQGNLTALEAVLSELESESLDGWIFLGDYAFAGPRPAECVDRIRAIDGAVTLLGSGDEDLANLESDTPFEAWGRSLLGEERVEWLGSRPITHEVDGLLAMHASPVSPQVIFAVDSGPFDEYPMIFPEFAEELLDGARANLMVTGHLHFSHNGELGEEEPDPQRVTHVGSVGFPFDGDTRAAYAIATGNDGHWEVEHRRVEYDVESVIADAEARGVPDPENIARCLREARKYGIR